MGHFVPVVALCRLSALPARVWRFLDSWGD